MKTKYEQVKSVHELAVKNGDANELRKIPPLLNSWGIKCRKDDGQLLWTNLSLPTSSIGETITIGLRYKKKDSTLTEDIFELNMINPDKVDSYYKGQYQQFRQEYQHTHKQQDIEIRSYTTVNTCCLYFQDKSGS
jgi:hypothetical protein